MTDNPKRSFIGVVVAKPGTLLRGGARVVESSRFETRQQAEAYCGAMRQPDMDRAFVKTSYRPAEILAIETGHEVQS